MMKKFGQSVAKKAGDGIQTIIDWILSKVRCPDRSKKNPKRPLGRENNPTYWNYLILNHPASRGASVELCSDYMKMIEKRVP